MTKQTVLLPASSDKRNLRPKNVVVYEVSNGVHALSHFKQKGFYKIGLLTSNANNHSRGKQEKTGRAVLLFVTPCSVHTTALIPKAQRGYLCVFSKKFLKDKLGSAGTQQLRMPYEEASSVHVLKPRQSDFILFLFRRMMMEQNTVYVFKDDLMRNYIYLILHEVFKIQAAHQFNCAAPA